MEDKQKIFELIDSSDIRNHFLGVELAKSIGIEFDELLWFKLNSKNNWTEFAKLPSHLVSDRYVDFLNFTLWFENYRTSWSLLIFLDDEQIFNETINIETTSLSFSEISNLLKSHL